MILMVDPYSIILMPWITEKTLEARRVADFDGSYKENNNRIEFIVRREATKPQIREAVEQIFGVRVTKVNTLNRKGKRKRNRKNFSYGKRADQKRALVTVADGDSIELFDV